MKSTRRRVRYCAAATRLAPEIIAVIDAAAKADFTDRATWIRRAIANALPPELRGAV